MAGLAEALDVDASLAALVGDDAVVAGHFKVAHVGLQRRQQFTVHLALVAGGQDYRVVMVEAGFAGGAIAQGQFDTQRAWGGLLHYGQGAERLAGDAGDFLAVENPVDSLDQVQVHYRVVGVLVFGDQTLTLGTDLLEHQVSKGRREHFVDERAVVGRFERRTAQDHVDLHRREAVIEVDKGFGRALATADHGDAHRLAVYARLAGHALQVLGMVKHPAIALERLECLGDARCAAGADHHRTGGAHMLLALGITGDHAQRLDLLLMQDRLDGQHFLAVVGLGLELPRHPAQVVVVLHAARVKGAQVDEVHQAVVGLEVVDEGVRAGGVAQGHQVLEEGNLQFTLGHQGIAVPAVVGLFVEKQHVQLALGLFTLLQGDGQRQVRRAETDPDQVMNRGRSNCLCHSSVLWISPMAVGREYLHGLNNRPCVDRKRGQ